MVDIERETLVEAAAAVGPVLAMIVALVFIGTTYGGGANLSPAGGQAVVVALLAFVVLLTMVGVYLSRFRD